MLLLTSVGGMCPVTLGSCAKAANGRVTAVGLEEAENENNETREIRKEMRRREKRGR